jgi:ribosomal protein S18 acetylase RimI-like enzyme
MSRLNPSNNQRSEVTLRSDLRPGDIGRIVYLHGRIYSREYGYDHTFETYVAAPLSKFADSPSPRERLWIAERGERIVGCVAIVSAAPDESNVDEAVDVAQLRWFLVRPDSRGAGIGRRLLNEAVHFSKAAGYGSIVLWTVSALEAAAHLYRSAGFRKIEEKAGRPWGVDVVEEKYEMII